jgi:hypothetical protein
VVQWQRQHRCVVSATTHAKCLFSPFDEIAVANATVRGKLIRMYFISFRIPLRFFVSVFERVWFVAVAFCNYAPNRRRLSRESTATCRCCACNNVGGGASGRHRHARNDLPTPHRTSQHKCVSGCPWRYVHHSVCSIVSRSLHQVTRNASCCFVYGSDAVCCCSFCRADGVWVERKVVGFEQSEFDPTTAMCGHLRRRRRLHRCSNRLIPVRFVQTR